MKHWLEKFIAHRWNRAAAQRPAVNSEHGLDLGARLVDGDRAPGRITIPQGRRVEHIGCLGITGQGKSSLMRYCAQQDVQTGHGFVYFDLHGDATSFLVAAVANQERIVQQDLSDRLIVIEPADQRTSVGINLLENDYENDRFVQIAEFAQILRQRWHLEAFGARTDELLRNTLHVLADNGLTLLELGPLLSHAAFRADCLKKVINPEIVQYFELRYDQASEPMRATMREPILNKTSAFTADRRFRDIVGQHSTFSVREAIDRGTWIILNLHKGRLGEQALTLGSLFFTTIKNALFARKSRELFTLYCDEMQNFVAYGDEIETVLSESRKFGGAIFGASQYLDLFPPEIRAAILAVGSHIFFRLSSADANQIAAALDGGKSLAELLKNLPRRHFVAKSGHERWQEGLVPTVNEPRIDPSDLLERSRARWARSRADIEEEIKRRQTAFHRSSKEVLHDWE